MAELIHSPTGAGPVNAFEHQVVQHLATALPHGYVVIPNFAIRDDQGRAYEYDVVVLAPHAVYVVEAKTWYGRLSGDDTEWMLNGKPRKCPLWLVDQKGKVLKSRIGIGGIWVEPLLVVPDGTAIHLAGNWAASVVTLGGLAPVVQDRYSVRYPAASPLAHGSIKAALLGKWQARQAETPRRFGSYEVVETIAQDAASGEYLARHAVMGGDERFRVRTWYLDPFAAPETRKQREAVIRRPADAITQIGRHPNLLPVLAFDFDEESNEFYEVTEWSAFGTLHGYFRHPEQQLTLRERLEIGAGVARALVAVHGRGLVHRNLSPEAILIGFDRQPRLTDFDRAYIAQKETVFPTTSDRRRNHAYVPPELADEASYDFVAGSDMYSFGVLLFELLTNAVPFDNPEAALRANGKPIALPSQLRMGVPGEIDTLIAGLLRVDNFNARPSAAEALAVLEEVLKGSSAAGAAMPAPPETTVSQPPGQPFAAGTLLDGVYRVDADLGGGSFSRVYKVYHLDQQRTFAMKVLAREEDADILLAEYNQVGRFLPRHPHIARLQWMSRLAPPARTPYILSDYVEGETLEPYCDGRKRLALSQIQSVGLKLLDALAALHGDPIPMQAGGLMHPAGAHHSQATGPHVFLHRDIKPANIMLELPSGEPKLIDFNISAPLGAATGRGGTPRYWAPDRGRPEWRPDADLFSLGIVLYELVAQRHPFPENRPEAGSPYPIRDVCPDLPISDALAAFLHRAIQPAAEDRFATAREMWQALHDIPNLHAPAQEAAPLHAGNAMLPGITLEPWEVGKPNYNPYVTRLLTLYSQARRTNAGTRGLDEIARFTYVKTRLDTHLAPAIADGRYRLVVVTGNAGDGKTAFLQRVEQYFQHDLGIAVSVLSNGNGSRWTHDHLEFESNYDGSQDEEDVESDTVLTRFFAPFADDLQAGLAGEQVRLIAINEGRLLDFLDHSAESHRFAALREQLKRGLDGEATAPALLVINLNVRAVAAGGTDSLVERQLREFLRDEIWAPCMGCSHLLRCPLRHNADSLRDRASGPAVRERVRRLFEVVHLRRRAHVTIRDLRSALSWLLLRDHGCDDVAFLLHQLDEAPTEDHRAQRRSDLVRLAYPAAFMSDDPAQRDTVDDRLVRLLRDADVGLMDDPRLDRRLNGDPENALPWMGFDSRSTYQRELLRAWASEGAHSLEDGPAVAVLSGRRRAVAMWRRWAFFERQDAGWAEMIPYRSLPLLEGVLRPADAAERTRAAGKLRDRIVEAISLSEGLRHPVLREKYLALRVSRVKNATIRSYRLFAREQFEVQVGIGMTPSEFIEAAPDAVELLPVQHGDVASLRVPLDLLEMLELIRRGYRPSPADLQGLFVNLVIFRNELLNLPFKEVMLTPDDESFYRLAGSASAQGVIQLDLQRVDGAVLNQIAAEASR